MPAIRGDRKTRIPRSGVPYLLEHETQRKAQIIEKVLGVCHHVGRARDGLVVIYSHSQKTINLVILTMFLTDTF